MPPTSIPLTEAQIIAIRQRITPLEDVIRDTRQLATNQGSRSALHQALAACDTIRGLVNAAETAERPDLTKREG